jgi:hypothetical protein
MNQNELACMKTLIAITLLAISGCAQQSSGTMPATPSLASSASVRPGTSASLSQKYKVDFPTPSGLDAGFSPSVSMLSPQTLVEEHTNEGKLYYRFGQFSGDGVAWGATTPIGDGIDPGIATSGNTIVDVHYNIYQGFLYDVGGIAGSNRINWQKPVVYDSGSGDFPHVAFAGGNNLVEVHYSDTGKLWYHLGTLDPAKQQINFGKSIPLDSGYGPSVAANSNGVVIELHSGALLYGYSHQYYHVGKIDPKNNKVDWGASAAVPNTVSSVSNVTWSPQGYIVVTYICSAPYPFNIYYLCTQMGTLNADNKTISWYGTSKSALIDTNPGSFSTALNGDSAITMLGYLDVPAKLQYSTSLLGDRSNWEGDRLDSTLKGKSLHQIVFPASHDAGMYVDTSGGGGAEALAQDQNLYQQLTGGQRYFDLRPDYNFYYYHGPVEGGSVQDSLNDVAKYMREGHREVVILKFSHFDFTSATQYTQLYTMISNTLKAWLYTNKTKMRLADIPLSTLLNGTKGVVLPVIDTSAATVGVDGIYTYRDYEDKDKPQNGQVTVFDQYTDTESYTKMKNDQLAKFAAFNGQMLNAPSTPCDFFLLSWTLTPVSEVYSVAGEADAELGPVMAGVQRNAHNQIPNLLYVDFYEWADPADVAIGMNSRF